jgi:hypothetical protein
VLAARPGPPPAGRVGDHDAAERAGPERPPREVASHRGCSPASCSCRARRIPLASDPLGDGADIFGTAGVTVDYALIGAQPFWYIQIGMVVLGHVAALVLAHDRAVAIYVDPGDATRSQYWMLAVMIGLRRSPYGSCLRRARASDGRARARRRLGDGRPAIALIAWLAFCQPGDCWSRRREPDG